MIFEEFLGIPYQIVEESRDDTLIEVGDKKKLHISDQLLSVSQDVWLTPESLPKEPLERCSVPVQFSECLFNETTLPILYHEKINNGGFFIITENSVHIKIDIFGSVFFMLTLYEEYVDKKRDKHGRYYSRASISYREKFLLRPIVDEMVELLWASLKLLWPNMQRVEKQYSLVLTHDVDTPAEYYYLGYRTIAKRMIGDVVKRKSPRQALFRLKRSMQSKRSDAEKDPFNTFSYIMDQSEKYNCKSSFYFINYQSEGGNRERYSLDSPFIRKTIREISSRGHEIGLHTSYNTYKNCDLIKREFQYLRAVCEQENVHQELWGGRQHYLRWSHETFDYWDFAGLSYDSTLSYADHSGFRCGTSREFTVFSLESKKQLMLKERPLIAMECSIIDDAYMGLGNGTEALQVFMRLKDVCEKYSGNFVLLWHNDRFTRPAERHLYKTLISS